jgi:hypothetical protein
LVIFLTIGNLLPELAWVNEDTIELTWAGIIAFKCAGHSVRQKPDHQIPEIIRGIAHATAAFS